MSKYGVVIDSFADPEKTNVYSYFVEYFENPKMRRVKEEGNYYLYVAKFSVSGDIDFRYLVLVVPTTLAINEECEMRLLRWVSLQTRISKTDYRVESQTYVPRRLPSLNKKIVREELRAGINASSPPLFIYNVEDLPLKVELLPSKNSSYQNEGTLIRAIETYQTVIFFT